MYENKTQSLDNVLNSIIEQIRKFIDVEHAAIYLNEQDSLIRKPNFTLSTGLNFCDEDCININDQKNILALACQQKSSQLIGNLKNEPWNSLLSPPHPDIQSVLVVPILQTDNVIGIINIESSRINAFDKKDQYFLETFAEQLAVIIQQNHRLQLAEINDIIEEKTGGLIDLEEIANHILDIILKYASPEVGIISLWDEKIKELEILAFSGIDNVYPHQKYSEGISILAIQQQRDFYLPDINAPCPCCPDGSWKNNHIKFSNIEKIKSKFACPVIFNNKVLGIIDLYNKEVGAFKNSLPEIKFISNQLGIIIERTKNYKYNLKKEGQEIRNLWSFLGQSVMHNIKNNLITIVSNNYSAKKIVNNVEINDLLTSNDLIINETLEQIKRLPQETTLEIIDIHEVLNSVINRYKQIEQNGKVIKINKQLGIQPIKVEANCKNLQIIFKNLIDNAIAAMPNGGMIDITSIELPHRVEIYFKDNGIGISEELREKLFKSVCKSKTGGMGIFLKVSKYLLAGFHGDIQLNKSQEGKGTEMMLWLPKLSYTE